MSHSPVSYPAKITGYRVNEIHPNSVTIELINPDEGRSLGGIGDVVGEIHFSQEIHEDAPKSFFTRGGWVVAVMPISLLSTIITFLKSESELHFYQDGHFEVSQGKISSSFDSPLGIWRYHSESINITGYSIFLHTIERQVSSLATLTIFAEKTFPDASHFVGIGEISFFEQAVYSSLTEDKTRVFTNRAGMVCVKRSIYMLPLILDFLHEYGTISISESGDFNR